MLLSAGVALGSTAISGGALQLLGGTGTARGGVVSLVAGTANTLNAGPVVLAGSRCTTASCVAGLVSFTGGAGVGTTNTGGAVSITGGAGVATGGAVNIVSGSVHLLPLFRRCGAATARMLMSVWAYSSVSPPGVWCWPSFTCSCCCVS